MYPSPTGHRVSHLTMISKCTLFLQQCLDNKNSVILGDCNVPPHISWSSLTGTGGQSHRMRDFLNNYLTQKVTETARHNNTLVMLLSENSDLGNTNWSALTKKFKQDWLKIENWSLIFKGQTLQESDN